MSLLAVLVLVLVLLVVADQVGKHYAQRMVADRLAGQAPFTTAPAVTAQGFPFLTQVVAGRYNDVHFAATGLTLGDLHGVRFEGDLRGVHVALRDAIKGSVERIPIDTADGSITVPYAEFAKAINVPGVVLRENSGQLTVTAPVQVPLLGKTLAVVADGRVGLAGQQLQITVDNIRVAGVSLPQLVVRSVSDLLNSQVSLPALPYGLQLTRVSAQPDGLQVFAAGRDVTLAAP